MSMRTFKQAKRDIRRSRRLAREAGMLNSIAQSVRSQHFAAATQA